MIKTLNITNLSQAGLNTDSAPWDLPPNYLTDVRNMRIVTNKISNYRGYSIVDMLPAGFDPGYIINVNASTGAYWVICGKDKVYKYDGTTFTDISVDPLTPYNVADPIEWTGCIITDVVIVNHPQTHPQYYSTQTGKLEYLPWDVFNGWDDEVERCRVMRSHKQHLFALDLNSPTIGEAPDGVRWSSPADIGSVPIYWDPTLDTQTTGLTNLGGEGGRIIDGYSLRDAFVVYRETAISVFDFVGGPFVWRIRNQSTTFGLLNEDCIVEVNGLHYFISQNDIYVNDGNNVKPLLDDVIQEKFVSLIDYDNFKNAYAIKYDVFDEIWFCIPTKGNVSPYASTAFVLNWRDNTWTILDLPAKSLRHAAYGTYTSALSGVSWANAEGTWENYVGPWLTGGVSPVVSTFIGIQGPGEVAGETDGALIDADASVSYTGYPSTVYIERVGIPLEGLGKVTTINRVYPRMQGQGKVKISIGSQDYQNSPIRWKPSVIFDPVKDRKIDVRTTGELHCYRIESVNPSNPTRWSISGLDIEYVDAGLR